MAQLGARFHGMEEVVSSNLTRSTKTFQTLTAKRKIRSTPLVPVWCPKHSGGLGSMPFAARPTGERASGGFGRHGSVGGVFRGDSLAERNGPAPIHDDARALGSYRAKNSGALNDCTPWRPSGEKRGGQRGHRALPCPGCALRQLAGPPSWGSMPVFLKKRIRCCCSDRFNRRVGLFPGRKRILPHGSD